MTRRLRWWGRLRHRLRLRSAASPVRVLVYQPGKVGSVAIAHSLRAAGIGLPVESAHVISEEGLRAAEAFHHSLGISTLPTYVHEGRRLAHEIRTRADVSWKVITAFRDPIARIVSGFFEEAARLRPREFPARGEWRYEDVDRHLRRVLESFHAPSDYTTGWFDRELRAVFGVDVLAEEFDHDAGFSVLRRGRTDVLVVKYESLESAFVRSAGAFLGLDRPIPLVRANETEKKPHAAIYAQTLRRFRIPREVCERIYATRLVRRLYPPSERETFLARWSGPATLS